MWQINSQYINSVCTSWNKGVRRILNLPHDAHTWLLGPLLKQNHIKKQFIVKTLRLLFCMLKSHNGVVEVCTLNTLYNANSPMGSTLCFFCVLNMDLISNHIDLFHRPCLCYQLQSIQQNIYVLL